MESHLTGSFKRKLVEGEYDNDVDRFMFSVLDDSTMQLRECQTSIARPGVMIGDICFESAKICRKFWNDEMDGYFFHPDHISLCRNKTYWDEERNKGFCGDGWHQCRGNWPGFCARDNNQKALAEKVLPDYDCPDVTHDYIPGEQCDDKLESHFGCLFECKDNSTRIARFQVCDGIPQCKDESDEDEDFCSDCSRDYGYPRRIVGPSDKPVAWRATFPCKHRYTGRPICVVPCDGVDGLCEEYSDEQCQVSSNHLQDSFSLFHL